jgi:hypothetical protein
MSYAINLDGVEHHPAVREMVDVLCAKTQQVDRSFFNCEVAYFLGKMAANMRATIVTKDRGQIPVNIYALALATSGYGKGHSVSLMETEFLRPFTNRFMQDTMPVISEQHLWKIANDRAARKGTTGQEEFEIAQGEYNRCGGFPFTFDSGSTPAVKQLRQKLLLGAVGAINLQIDEIGSNLTGSDELLTTFLELYDQGVVKQKLTKNTNDNQRGEDIDGKTPANMMLFGTPAKLFDGSQTEDLFYSFLEIGYARRCLFGYGQQHARASETMTPAEIYAHLIQPSNSTNINKWAVVFHKLADPAMYGWKMSVEDDVGIQLLTYKIACEQEADSLPEHEEIRKAELSHRYFKALKLAGAYAFVDQSSEIEMDHLMSAILLVEESGKSFQTILSREKAYVKLAKYIAAVGEDVTHADLHEALPFYKSGNAARNEMMTLATAWGYKKNIIIKKSFVDGIEFFRGETLEETDLSEMILSYSDSWAYNYLGERVPFDQLHVVAQQPGYHWANHHFRNGHRAEETVLAGFNMIVIDVDGDKTTSGGGVRLEQVHELLKDYKFFTYTTKRHTEQEHRFRLVLPINYVLELDADEYKEFMACVASWLPFKIDETANQRSRKWLSHPGNLNSDTEEYEGAQYHYNLDGELLDALDFIPKTSRNEAYKHQTQKLESLDNLERWFAQRIATGNRNNHMIKFALALVDSGMDLPSVSTQVHAFNKKLNTPLTETELDNTIMVTVAKRYSPN